MEYLDARRLTGPSLLWNRAGSILDVQCTQDDTRKLIPVWDKHVKAMLGAVGWDQEITCHWPLSGGVSLAFSAPIDALYAASAINEWAWACCQAAFGEAKMPDFDEAIEEVQSAIEEEKNPALLDLEQAANEHGMSFLWDDDYVSIGHGKGSQTWPFRELPSSDDLDWSHFHDVPTALVTGTNGKTTTVRLATHILRGCGRNVGMSSTDWISVNEKIIDRGDWSGPGGARSVLREPEVDVAILETARGGLLRRGLGVSQADAALITNISEDHLGDFGSQNLHELLNIKWIVSRAVEKTGALILNADDPLLVGKSAEFPGKLIWFSLDAKNAVIDLHTRAGGIAFVLDNGDLLRLEGDAVEVICAAAEVPITMEGAATHNTANALAAAALTDRLGIPMAEIRAGLTTMSQDDNPGRSNIYMADGVSVLVDFAHNPAAMQALFDMAKAIPAKRRVLSFGQAGDRTDDLIRQLARNAWAIGLDKIIVSELEVYWRGREYGDVFALIKDELLRCGATEDQILHFMTEDESLDAALEWAQEGDLVIMLALGGSTPIIEKLTGMES
ncbi:MAG: Mur ligase [Acidiferrobacteraceae bacterium]|nr:Mur ligase [Acidiferrobacteraceae bacterium]MBT3640119.1 Mur ligase [Acidiferrobacteraceae bacterium]MBT3770196.1 Mur ligase [Acidiferrobacteraceae bacterium]MBT4396360.1 Mur ligase [Acidiferrobacteraceae bacterium]MBT4405769.1 Mur ligase [Acidiferrobacteraceae bacterium]